jgi:hypothetical protein
MSAADDLKSLDRLEQVVLGAGVVAFIVAFFPFYGYSFSGAGISLSYSVSAWHSWSFLGMILVLAATVVAAVRLFSAQTLESLPVGGNLVTLVLSGLGTLLVILRAFTYKHVSGAGGSVGVKWGGYLLMIVLIVQVVAAFLLFRKSEEVLPDFKALQANRTTASQTGAPAAPPAATYPPSTPTTPAEDLSHADHPAEPPAPSV